MVDSDKKPKVGRTVKLESDINDRLIALCSHLGVNPNSYLLNIIGERISKDEVSFMASNHANNSQELLANFFENISKSAE